MRRLIGVGLVAVFWGCWAGGVAAETYEELYRRIFGKELVVEDIDIQATLVIDGRRYGQISVTIKSVGTDFSIQTQDIQPRLANVLTPEGIQQFQDEVGSSERTTQDHLNRLGYNTALDKEKLLVTIETPPEIRKEVEILLRQQRRSFLTPSVYRARPVSGFLNVNTTTLQGDDQSGTTIGFDHTLSVGKVIFRNGVDYVNSSDSSWQLGEMSVQLPNYEKGMFYQAGDLDFIPIGFQNNFRLTGVGVQSQFDLIPDIEPSPQLEWPLALADRSRIKIMFNGKSIFDKDLTAGRYVFKRFPLRRGDNHIEVHQKTESGLERVTTQNFVYDQSLLDPRWVFQSYQVGFPVSFSGSSRDVNTDEMTLMANRVVGLTPTHTLGGYLDARAGHWDGGVQNQFAYGGGTLGVDVGARLSGESPIGLGSRLSYRSHWKAGLLRQWGSILDLRTAHFGSIDIDRLPDAASYQCSIFGQFGFWKDWDMNASLRLSDSGAEDGQDWGLSVFISRRWGGYQTSRLTTNLSDESDVALSHQIRTQDRQHQLEVEGRSRDNRGELEWRYRPDWADDLSGGSRFAAGDTKTEWDTFWSYGHNVNVWDASVSLTDEDGTKTWDQFFSYRGGRGEVQISRTSPGTTAFQVGTAIAYTDQAWAISEPIDRNFVILYPHKAFKGQKVIVNDSVAIDWMGPAVLADVEPLRVADLRLEAPGLPLGRSLGGRIRQVYIPAGAGTSVQVGTAAQVILIGRLVNEKGDPIILKGGHLSRVDSPDAKPKTFFSNRVGQIQVLELGGGDYQLKLFDQDYAPVIINIPDNQSGIYRSDDIRVPQINP